MKRRNGHVTYFTREQWLGLRQRGAPASIRSNGADTALHFPQSPRSCLLPGGTA